MAEDDIEINYFHTSLTNFVMVSFVPVCALMLIEHIFFLPKSPTLANFAYRFTALQRMKTILNAMIGCGPINHKISFK